MKRWLLGVFMLAVAAWLAESVWQVRRQILARGMTESARPRIATSKDIAAHSLGASVWVDSAKIYEDQEIRVDLNLENHTGDIVTLTSVEIQTQGFDPVGACWQQGNRPACIEGSDRAGNLPAKLAPGASLHLHGEMKPRSTGRRGLLAIYRWSEPGKKITEMYTRGVDLEPIEVTTRGEEFLASFANYADKLALPLVLAIGGALWGLFTSARENRRDEMAKARETAFQVKKEQWTRIFDYTQQYYLRISLSIRRLAMAADASDQDQTAYYLTTYWLHKTSLVNKGGWVFSTKDGEELVATAQALFMLQVPKHLQQTLDQAVDHLDGPVSFPQYKERIKTELFPDAPFARARHEASDWIKTDAAGFKHALNLLKMMREVMKFEWDRPFVEHWYDREPEWIAEKFEELERAIANGPSSDELTKLRNLALNYAIGVEEYVKGVKRRDRSWKNAKLRVVRHFRRKRLGLGN